MKTKRVIINRPAKANALNQRILRKLANEVTDAYEEGSTIILSGAGKTFSAGLDLKELSSDTIGLLLYLCHLLIAHPRPTVCIVHGTVIGGGLALARSCDYVIANRDIQLRVPNELESYARIIDATINYQVMKRDKDGRDTWVGYQDITQNAFNCGLVDECFSHKTIGELFDCAQEKLQKVESKN